MINKPALLILFILPLITLSYLGCKNDITFLHNPTITIPFYLSQDSFVTLIIYDNLGGQVAKPLDQVGFPEGSSDVGFNTTLLATGVYYYRITIEPMNDNGTTTGVIYISDKRMLLIK
jgi:hypothetical protein